MSEPTPSHEPAAAREALDAQLGAAARRSALGHVTPGEAPTGTALLAAMGGVRGLIESILPGFGFLVVYLIAKDLVWSIAAPALVAVAFLVIRLVRREPVSSAITGLLGIGVSAALALWTGQAKDNFVPGFVINAVASVAIIVSLIARRPLIGLIAGFLIGSKRWRRDRARVRVATVATVLWLGLFVARLAVEVPLYLADATEGLAAAKLLMGVPLYAAVLWVTWLMLRTAWTRPAAGEQPAPDAR